MDIHNGVGSLSTTENDVTTASLDLFQPITKESTLTLGRNRAYRPLSMAEGGPYEFSILPAGDTYLQTSSARLFAELRVVRRNGNNIPNDADVSITNLVLSSLFSSVQVYFNGVAVTDLDCTNVGYKTYVETLLSYGQTAYKSHLTASMFAMDSPTQFDTVTNPHIADVAIPPGANSGFNWRATHIGESRMFQVMSTVPCDFLQTDRLFPPGIKLGLKFSLASNNFPLLAAAGGEYKIQIVTLKLYMRHITTAPQIVNEHMRLWSSKNVILPFKKTVITTASIGAGLREFKVSNVINGTLPHSVIIGLVRNTAYNGDIDRNPYNFQHFNMNGVSLHINNESLPNEPYRPDFEHGYAVRLYRDLFDNTGVSHDDCGSILTYSLFLGGCALIAWDLSPDLCNGYHLHTSHSGLLELNVTFSQALVQPITMVIFSTFDAVVSIDKNHNFGVSIV